jgi:hypothetical protein
MAQFTTDQLKAELEKNIKQFMERGNPIEALKAQAASLRSFQDQVTKQVGETKSLLDRAKDFLKDPKGEGIKIVKDGLKAADKFFADIFKLLTKDVGTIIKNTFKDIVSKITTNFDKFLKKILTELSKNLTKIGTGLLKSENKIKQFLAKSLGTVVTGLNKTLANWGKSSGLTKAMQQIPKMANEIAKSSQALAGVKDITKAFPTILNFVKLFGKLAPILSTLADVKWKNDSDNRQREMIAMIKANAAVSDRQFQALGTLLRRIESSTKGGQELGTIARNSSQTLSEIKAVNAAVRQGSTKSDAIQASINRVGAQNYGPQLQSIQSTVNTISAQTRSNQGTQQQKDYSSQLAAISSALGTLNAKAQVQPTPIDYGKVQQAAQQALSTFKPAEVKIPSDLARKSDLAGLAKKSDVDAIPDKIKQPDFTQDFSQILNAVTIVNGSIVRLGADIARNTVNLQPLQQQLTSLSGQIASLPGTITNSVSNNVRNTVTNLGNIITNSVSNIITNNNQTIVNNIGKGLDPLSIINPIKSHINTEVAAPLKTTMKVLNVNDLEKGLNISGEALIKQSGFQQFGSDTPAPATANNLIGLMGLIAAPLFFRAGFQKLGGSFDQSVMQPEKGKVKIDDALSASLWTFKQVDERLGLANKHSVKGMGGAVVQVQHKNVHDGIEEINANTIAQGQDLEIVERYIVAIAQDIQKLMQITLQTREDVDVLIDDTGCKFEEVKKSHPSHLKLTAPGMTSSLLDLFQQGQVHYVARTWKGNADKHQMLERIGLDTQISAMSNKFEMPDVSNITLPLDKSTARKSKAADDETWKIFVSTMEEPPAVYGVAGNPIPEIKEIKTGTVREITKPTNPNKKLGQ